MVNTEDRIISYHNFISKAKNEPLWKRLRLSEKLYLLQTFRTIFEKCPREDLRVFNSNPSMLFSHISERGINRFKRLNEYVDSLGRADLSSDKKIQEFKASIRGKMNFHR